MKLEKNISLAQHTTWQVGGQAQYFILIKNTNELKEALQVAYNKQLPVFILGGGSNVLFPDKGFEGLVIKMKNKEIKIEDKIIEAEAGASLNSLGQLALRNNLTGFEWAVGIPGTLGGALFGNAGAFDKNIFDNLKSLKVLRRNNILELQKKDLNFDYRHSPFKGSQDIIISAKIQLKEGLKKDIQEKMKTYLTHRTTKQPLDKASAGCVFKNPKPDQPTGRLIEACNLKGKQVGQAMVSKKHANFIINLGGATAEDVLKLIQIIEDEVFKKFKVKLKREVQIL